MMMMIPQVMMMIPSHTLNPFVSLHSSTDNR